MNKNLDALQKEFDVFMENARKTDNKAAARRARTAITPLSNRMKQFRKDSIK